MFTLWQQPPRPYLLELSNLEHRNKESDYRLDSQLDLDKQRRILRQVHLGVVPRQVLEIENSRELPDIDFDARLALVSSVVGGEIHILWIR